MREKIFCRLCLTVLWFLFLFVLFAPHGAYLAEENRPISAFSPDAPDGYFTDRLPMREELLRLNRDMLFLLGKREFGSAFFGENGYIFSKEATDADALSKNLEAISLFAAQTKTTVYTALVGAKQDVLYAALPPLYADDRGALWDAFSESGLQRIDLLPILLKNGGEGKYLYYRGDHHLTSLGSYYCYREIASALGITPYAAKDFSVSVVRADFSGSDARKLLCETADKIALFRYAEDDAFFVEDLDSGESRYGLYDDAKLHSADPYGVFPIADCGYARITLQNAERKRLLLICDSFGDTLVPFLARHFDIDCIDPRYYGGSVQTLVKGNEYTAVLVYFGMDTLAGREVLYRLRF